MAGLTIYRSHEIQRGGAATQPTPPCPLGSTLQNGPAAEGACRFLFHPVCFWVRTPQQIEGIGKNREILKMKLFSLCLLFFLQKINHPMITGHRYGHVTFPPLSHPSPCFFLLFFFFFFLGAIELIQLFILGRHPDGAEKLTFKQTDNQIQL